MALTFFPIEDPNELEELRKLRSKFMENVSKCFQTKSVIKGVEMKEVCQQIIKHASSHVDPKLKTKLEGVIFHQSNKTLNKEHEKLVDFNMK